MTNNIGIDKLRVCKRKLKQLNKNIIAGTDVFPEDGLIESDVLKQMMLISQIDELITDVIYYIIDK